MLHSSPVNVEFLNRTFDIVAQLVIPCRQSTALVMIRRDVGAEAPYCAQARPCYGLVTFGAYINTATLPGAIGSTYCLFVRWFLHKCHRPPGIWSSSATTSWTCVHIPARCSRTRNTTVQILYKIKDYDELSCNGDESNFYLDTNWNNNESYNKWGLVV